jgi:hypothetical protein
MYTARVEQEELRIKCEWNQTASLMALIANCHRDPKKRSDPFTPTDFNPFTQTEHAPLRKIKPSQLARILCGNERPEVVLADITAQETADMLVPQPPAAPSS